MSPAARRRPAKRPEPEGANGEGVARFRRRQGMRRKLLASAAQLFRKAGDGGVSVSAIARLIAASVASCVSSTIPK